MIDYISREDALTVIKYSKTPVVGIKNLPQLNPDDIVKHGKWMRSKDLTHYCSICNEWCGGYVGKYCSNCGAKMDLGVLNETNNL